MRFLPELVLWRDERPRSGPQNMAVDAWLLDTADAPVLRVYDWEPEWGSFGVFGTVAEAAAAFAAPPRHWVRRMTGGGVVDHRNDWTYTLVIPRGEAGGAVLGAGASYQRIHAALAGALGSAGEAAVMLDECGCGDVAFDLVDAAGRKCAGAGQRRTRRGLLHQGSVLTGMADRGALGSALAAALARTVTTVSFDPPVAELDARAQHYASAAWMGRRG
jgi:lipoate-protein ligase A